MAHLIVSGTQYNCSLNAEVNALDRLEIVRGRNSSYFGSKHRSADADLVGTPPKGGNSGSGVV
jgi:hypothetical protein